MRRSSGNVLSGAGADQDVDGDMLPVSQVSGASGSFAAAAPVAGRFGALIIFANGSFSYVADNAETLAAGQSGLDVFTYTVSDGKGGTDTATLTISVVARTPEPQVMITSMAPMRLRPFRRRRQ